MGSGLGLVQQTFQLSDRCPAFGQRGSDQAASETTTPKGKSFGVRVDRWARFTEADRYLFRKNDTIRRTADLAHCPEAELKQVAGNYASGKRRGAAPSRYPATPAGIVIDPNLVS